MRGGPQVVFDGWYGRRNAGDDAFCVVAAEIARGRWGVERAAFIGPPSELPTLPIDARGVFPERPRVRGHGRLAPIPAMLRARRVVHVGGSTFTHRLTRQRDETRLARAGLIQLHAVGVSIGPFANSADAMQVGEVLRRFRTVSVRDTASLARAAQLDLSLDVALGFDAAVLLPWLQRLPSAPPSPEAPSRRPVLGVSVCPDDSTRDGDPGRGEPRQRGMRALVSEVVKRSGAAVRLLVFNDHPRVGDLAVSRELAGHLEALTDVEVVTRSADARHLFAAVASCDAVIGTRLHSAVFAYACDVPFALVAYQRKCADFAAEVGLPDELVFPAEGPGPDADAAAVAALLNDPVPQLRAGLSVSVARERAQRAFPDLS